MFSYYYRTLGITSTASEDEIKTAYRKLTKLYHPDSYKGPRDPNKIMIEINQAYAVLHNKESREKYDRELAEHEHQMDLEREERIRESRRRAAGYSQSSTSYSQTSATAPEAKDYHEEYNDEWCLKNGFEVLRSKYSHAETYKEYKKDRKDTVIMGIIGLIIIITVITTALYGLDVLIRGSEATRLYKVIFDFISEVVNATIRNYRETGRLIIG